MIVPDLLEAPSWPLRDVAVAAGLRTTLVVPLIRAERRFGALVLFRKEARALRAPHGRPDADLRHPVRGSDPECASVPRDRAEGHQLESRASTSHSSWPT